MIQLDLEDAIREQELKSPYRDGLPGFKERGGASEEAAKKVKGGAHKLRKIIHDLITIRGPMTYKEVCAVLPSYDKDYIKPRLSELLSDGKLTKLKNERRQGCTPYARA